MKNLITAFPQYLETSKFDKSINLRLEYPTHQVMWSFDHVVT